MFDVMAASAIFGVARYYITSVKVSSKSSSGLTSLDAAPFAGVPTSRGRPAGRDIARERLDVAADSSRDASGEAGRPILVNVAVSRHGRDDEA